MHLDVHNWFHNFHYLRNLPSKPEKGKCAVRDCFFLFSAPSRFIFNPDVIRQVLSQMYWFFKEGEFLWGSWDIFHSLLLVFPFVFFEMYVWISKDIAICGVILIGTQWKVFCGDAFFFSFFSDILRFCAVQARRVLRAGRCCRLRHFGNGLAWQRSSAAGQSLVQVSSWRTTPTLSTSFHKWKSGHRHVRTFWPLGRLSCDKGSWVVYPKRCEPVANMD